MHFALLPSWLPGRLIGAFEVGQQLFRIRNSLNFCIHRKKRLQKMRWVEYKTVTKKSEFSGQLDEPIMQSSVWILGIFQSINSQTSFCPRCKFDQVRGEKGTWQFENIEFELQFEFQIMWNMWPPRKSLNSISVFFAFGETCKKCNKGGWVFRGVPYVLVSSHELWKLMQKPKFHSCILCWGETCKKCNKGLEVCPMY